MSGPSGMIGANVLSFVEKLESNHDPGIVFLQKMEAFLVHLLLTKSWLLAFLDIVIVSSIRSI